MKKLQVSRKNVTHRSTCLEIFINIFYESAQIQTLLLNDFCSGLCPQNIIGSGSVRVHLHKILKVRVRFRFTDLKY